MEGFLINMRPATAMGRQHGYRQRDGHAIARLAISLFRWLPGHTNLITPYSGSVDRQGVHLNLDHTKALELKFFVTNLPRRSLIPERL
ncbi:hypothetical protein [Paraburkholderia sacchari]|uniref:Uncharacterized protein n=1 Tax=Paraburkholderia sacchari TaxID=159450 RepID=A0A8T6Z611_9BURK|nr:hypothetical protein [Paraburkholderia sacchari]NLP60325.1 hypothetical protein [Paraburkholderia sacchari]